MLRGESDQLLKRIMAFFPICLFFVTLPSFAVSVPDPLDSSYEIQEDVSVLSVPPVELLADTGTTYRVAGEYSNLGHYITKANVSGMTDTNLQYAINYNADANAREIYRLENYIAERASSGLTQGQLDSSLGNFWSIFDVPYLFQDGTIKQTTNAETLNPKDWLRLGILGLASKLDIAKSTGYKMWFWDYSGETAKHVSGNKSFSEFTAYVTDSLSYIARTPSPYYLNSQGVEGFIKYGSSISDLVRSGFLGTSFVLRGSSGSSLSGSLLNYSDLSSVSYSSNNILGSFKPLFDIQNDLARLAHVIADPTEQALHDATKDDIQAVTDNLTGSNGVTPSAVGDVAGISSGVGSFMESGVDSSRLSDSLSDSSNFSFFSQQTASDLDTVPSVQSDSVDDYIDFYALNRDAFKRELGD